MTQAMNQPFSIERPVGERETNRSDDLEAVRNALAARGLCQRTVTGPRNATFKPDLTAGIRIFQRQAGLDPDGLVLPGGPTALALAYGGSVAGAPTTAEGKQFNVDVCQEILEQIANAKREIADAKRRARELIARRRSSEQQRDQLRNWLRSALVGLISGGVPDDDDLDDLLRELDQVPEDLRTQARRAADLVRSLLGVVREIQKLIGDESGAVATLTVWEETLKVLEARKKRNNCDGSA